MLRVRRYLNTKTGKKYLSEVLLNSSLAAIDKSCPFDASMASEDFIQKFQTNYINIYENISIGELNSQTSKTSTVTENIKALETMDELNSCLVLKWHCGVTDNALNTRKASGQIYLKLNKLNNSVTVPEMKVIKSTTEQSTNLILFGPDRILIDKASNADSEKNTAQKLLIRFGLKHPTQIEHNFSAISVCLVPVQMLVSNNSDMELLTTVDTTTNARLVLLPRNPQKHIF